MKKDKLIVLLLTLLVSMTSFAQKTNCSGDVVDAAGEPVIGASIVEKGTSNGAVTDLDGKFSVSVTPGATLVVSYVGYATREMKAAPNLHIVLQEDSKLIDEVVIVGYGVQKKSVVTASIAKVGADDLQLAAPTRMDNALKGLAAGVTVTSASGQPGAAARVRVRGVGTINNSDPLFIVDGMPVEGNIDYINPSDIESMEVLKDAASGAIYGARAANGVIIVTTKRGRLGKVSVNYNFSYGWQKAWKRRDVLDATAYALMMNEGAVNSGMAPVYADPYSYGKGTDWQNAVFNDNAPVANHEVNVSGATEKLNYYLAFGYNNQEGIVGGNYNKSNYRRLTLRSNTNYTIFDDSKERAWLNKLDVQVNLSYARIKSTSIEANSQWGSVLGSALMLSPLLPVSIPASDAAAQAAEIARMQEATKVTDPKTNEVTGYNYKPVYGPNGELFYTPGADYHEMNNPVAMLNLPSAPTWVHKFVANFAATLNIGWGLSYRLSYGGDINFNGIDTGYTPYYYLSGNNLATKSSVTAQSNRASIWQVENVLTWTRQFGRHDINVVLGQTAKQSTGWYLGGSRSYPVSARKPYIDFATGLAVYTEGNHNVLFGRNNTEIIGTQAGGLANPDLKWEESVQTDFGLDFGLFQNALTFTVDWYRKVTNGMLMEVPVPQYVGSARPIGNVGKMENTGVELEAGYKFRVADARFHVKGNAAYLRNKLVNLGNDTGYQNYDHLQGVGTITRAQNGQPFPFFYGYKTNGVFQNMAEVKAYVNAEGTMIQPNAVPGDVRFVDVNGDGKISQEGDMTKIGKGMPDWTFGLTLSADWRGFDFSMMWQGVTGCDVFDATTRTDISVSNLPSWMLGRWTGEGTSNHYPRYCTVDTHNNWLSSDLYVHDASYLRLKNLQLGYTLPRTLTHKLFVDRLRVFLSAENLITWTKYHGFDPEISSGGTSLGVDYGVYPQARVWTVGVNVGF